TSGGGPRARSGGRSARPPGTSFHSPLAPAGGRGVAGGGEGGGGGCPWPVGGARRRAAESARWRSTPWPLRREHLYLIAGDSPMGLRLPLATLPWVLPEDVEPTLPPDPFAARGALDDPSGDAPPPSPLAAE